MAVLMIGDVPNLTEEIYGGLVEQMKPLNDGGERVHRPLRRATSRRRVAGGRDLGDPKQTARHGSTTTSSRPCRPTIVPTRTYYPLHSAFTA